jgi:hypothetical protein
MNALPIMKFSEMTPWSVAIGMLDVPKNVVRKVGRPPTHPVIDGVKQCSVCSSSLPTSSYRYQEGIGRLRGECRRCEAAKRRESRCI